MELVLFSLSSSLYLVGYYKKFSFSSPFVFHADIINIHSNMFPRISLAFFYQLQFLFYFRTESFSSAFCKCSCDLNVGSISSNFALRYCFYHEKSDANNFDNVCMASFLFVISKYELNMTRIFSIKESTSMCIGVGEREIIFFSSYSKTHTRLEQMFPYLFTVSIIISSWDVFLPLHMFIRFHFIFVCVLFSLCTLSLLFYFLFLLFKVNTQNADRTTKIYSSLRVPFFYHISQPAFLI